MAQLLRQQAAGDLEELDRLSVAQRADDCRPDASALDDACFSEHRDVLREVRRLQTGQLGQLGQLCSLWARSSSTRTRAGCAIALNSAAFASVTGRALPDIALVVLLIYISVN